MKIVVFDNPETVNITKINVAKIYAVSAGRYVYKLHKLGADGWAMVSMNSSMCWCSGSHRTAEDALIASKDSGTIYQFDTQKEFVDWAAKQ